MGQPLMKRDRELLEIIVNAEPAARREVEADGSEQQLDFTFPCGKAVGLRRKFSPLRPPTTMRDREWQADPRIPQSAQWCL